MALTSDRQNFNHVIMLLLYIDSYGFIGLAPTFREKSEIGLFSDPPVFSSVQTIRWN